MAQRMQALQPTPGTLCARCTQNIAVGHHTCPHYVQRNSVRNKLILECAVALYNDSPCCGVCREIATDRLESLFRPTLKSREI